MPINFRDLPAPLPDPGAIGLLPGSPEQQAIWGELLYGDTHLIVRACAGTGKSWSIVQGILRMKDISPRPSIAVFAFNKHIEVGMNSKFRAAGITFASAMTYNSFGWRACLRTFHCNFDKDNLKTGRIIEEVLEDTYGLDKIPYHQRHELMSGLRRLVSLCKVYLYDGTDKEQLDLLCGKHDIPLNGSATLAYPCVPLVLQKCADETSLMDFEDQIWQTVTKRLLVPKFDILFIDEAQDTSPNQQELALMACPTGRIVFVGDERQSIYGFRGGGVDSIPLMEKRLSESGRGCKSLPLTVTRRCPKSHVRLAQAIVPEIQAMDDAPEGIVECLDRSLAVKQMHPGDLVLCRINAALVPVAYALIQNNTKVVIRGKDIGTNLRTLIDKLKAGESVPNLLEKLVVYERQEIAKLRSLGEKGQSKVQALLDSTECVTALCEGMNSVSAIKTKIDRIFADFDEQGVPKDAVILGSVHRTKGLEAGTIWILAPELLPHPMASQAWEVAQEEHLAYIAVTRAKYTAEFEGRLVFVRAKGSNGIPKIYTQQAGLDAARATAPDLSETRLLAWRLGLWERTKRG